MNCSVRIRCLTPQIFPNSHSHRRCQY